MKTHAFDTLTRTLGQPASRRTVVAGVAAAALAGASLRAVASAPSPKAACMKEATAAAQTCRNEAECLKGKERAAALKACQASFRAAREICVDADDDSEDGSGM